MIRIIFYLIFVITIPVFSGELPVFHAESVEFEPENVRTGDNVFCRIKVYEKLSFEDISTIKISNDESFSVTDIHVNAASNEILLWFIPFNPQRRMLPEIKTSRFVVEDIKLEIKGYLEPGDTMPEPPGAVLLPGTRLFFGFTFFIILIFVFFGYYLFRAFYKPVKGGISAIISELELKKILSLLKSIDPAGFKDHPEVYCHKLNSIFKLYLEKKLSSAFLSLTSSEISIKLAECPFIDEAAAEKIKKSLIISDMIRFGKNSYPDNKILILLKEPLVSAADAIDDALKKGEARNGI